MTIESSQLLDLLRQFAALTQLQQRLFIHCLINCPRPVLYSPDLSDIAHAMGINIRTVQRGLKAIDQLSILAQCVKAVKVNKIEEVYFSELEQQERQSEIAEECLF